jgi:hypothetical protein
MFGARAGFAEYVPRPVPGFTFAFIVKAFAKPIYVFFIEVYLFSYAVLLYIFCNLFVVRPFPSKMRKKTGAP